MPPAKSTSKERKTWTVMVFMAAADSAALDAFAVRDLREMERGINATHTNVVVQMNRSWPDTPQRYRVARTEDDPPAGDSRFIPLPAEPYEKTQKPTPESDLTQFVSWAKEEFPAKYYFLVLWGHAYGLGFGRSHNRSITMSSLRQCLESQRVDVIGTNACAMSYVEAAYELRDCADYLVASQISVPFVGWPYESVLKQVDHNTTPEQFGRLIVDAYVGITTTASIEPVAMSLLSLAEAGKLKGLVSDFAQEIRAASRNNGSFSSDHLNHVRDIFMGATYGDVRPLIDVVGLCDDFGDSESDKLKTAASRLKTFVMNTLRIDHRPARDDLNGVGIYAPLVGDDTDLKRLELQNTPQMLARTAIGHMQPGTSGKRVYEDLQIFDDSKAWPQLVYDDLQHELSADVLNSVSAIDPSRLQDRRDVAQIVMAIGASFNKLDHLLATSERYVDREREGKPVAAAFKAKAMPISALGPPHLRLIQPIDPAEELALLETAAELAGLRGNTTKSKAVAAPRSDAPSIDVGKVVAFMRRVEAAIGNVETTVVRGLTNARFGLGPIGSSQTALGAAASLGIDTPKSGFGIDTPKSGFGGDTPKSGFGGDTPKSGFGGDTPKSGFGGDTPKSGFGMGGFGAGMSGDLRMDLALTRVVDLYRQVAEALFALEEAALSVEVTARTILSSRSARVMSAEDLKRASVQQTERAFRLLEDASMGARRVVRRVLAHPIYGIGPGSSDLGLEERQLLARAGGLDRRSLRLM
jgi:hypothetical protein